MTDVIGLLHVPGTVPCAGPRALLPHNLPRSASAQSLARTLFCQFAPAPPHSRPRSPLLFLLPGPTPSVLLSSVAGPRLLRLRSAGVLSPVRGLSVPGPHFSLGPGTVIGLWGVLASRVPAHFADLGHNSHGPATEQLRTWDTTPSDRGRT